MSRNSDATEDISRVSQAVTLAQWGVAAVVMVGSAMSAWSTFAQLHDTPAIGAVIAVGVDLALASGLVVSQRLRALGIENSPWGTALMWLTAAMTLALNAGADAVAQKWGLALLHAFPPILMVVLTEAGSANQLRVMRKRQEREAAEQAKREAEDKERQARYDAEQHQRRQEEIDRANGNLINASDYLKAAEEKRRAADAALAAERNALIELEALRRQREQRQAEEAAAREAEQKAARAIAERKPPVAGRQKPVRSNRKAPASAEEIRDWIRKQRGNGQDVTTAQVVEFAGIRRGNEKRLIDQVDAEINAEMDAELAKIGER